MNTNTPTDDNTAGPSTATTKPKIRRTRISSKAGLTFPVPVVERTLRQGNYSSSRYRKKASIFLTAAVENICTDILKKAGKMSENAKHNTLLVSDLVDGIQNDHDLKMLLDSDPGLDLIAEGPTPPGPADTQQHEQRQ
ncbi:hypothetical protein [Absidia glauca]|uniref:Histone H2A n=1 Tax=Absidia glauca TaxID=4829 RepID=A0A168Q770_ABSGL|nr:hypothetical protein [Absidia glauca]